MPRKKVTSTALVKADQPIVRLLAGGQQVVVDAVFHVPAVHPADKGPWSNEADKIAWRDEETGFGCIIRRSPVKGYLAGYVSIPPSHPLFGMCEDVLQQCDINVHRGIDYADECQHWEPENVSICHVTDMHWASRETSAANQTVYANKKARSHDQAWWIGFSCNHDGDVLPGTHYHDVDPASLWGVEERTYKNEAYVYQECVRLALQLKAIADKVDPRLADPGPSLLTSSIKEAR